jgi:TP901 family phage tail tape measure protein
MASGTLGELVVSITTDLTEFNKGLKKAESDIKNTTGKITEYTNKIGVTLTAVGAVITAAYGVMIKSATDYSDELYVVSQRTGIAVETLSKLKYVADQTESSFEAVATSFKFLSRNIYEAELGTGKAGQAFKALGITVRNEVTGELIKAEDAFLLISDKFKDLDDNAAKTALAMQLFGRGGQSIIPILNLGSEGIQRLSEEAKKLGIVLTTDNAKAIDEFTDSMQTLRSAILGLSLNATKILLPALEDLIKQATKFLITLREWTEAHPKLSENIVKFGLVLGVSTLALGTFMLVTVKTFQALQNMWIWLNAVIPLMQIFTTFKMAGLATDIGLLVVNVGLLYPLIVLAGTAFLSWKLGRFLDEVTGLDNLLSGPDGLFTKMFKWLDEITPKINDVINGIKRMSLAVATFGLSEIARKVFPSTPSTETPSTEEVDLGKISVTGSSKKTSLDETINLLAIHAEKLKNINEAYLIGKSTAEEYYNSIVGLMKDGIDQRQIEMDMITQSIELQRLSTDAEYAKIQVMQQSAQAAINYAQVKAQMQNQSIIDDQNTLISATNLLQTLQSMHRTMWQGIFDFINTGIKAFSKGFSDALSSIILGTKSGKEAFKEFGQMMIKTIVEFFVEWAVQSLIAATLGKLISASTIVMANTVAAAWLPAAIFASIATFGAASAAGAAGMTSAVVAGTTLFAGMKGASVAAMAEGGVVTKPTLALIGEAGPEAVIPLKDTGKGPGGVTIQFTNYGDFNTPVDIENMINELGNRVKNAVRGS